MKESCSKEPDWRDVATITKRSAVDLLSNRRAGRHLAPFLRSEHTLSSAAREVGAAPSTVAYWVPRFLDAGLIRTTKVQRRAGMAMTFYRAAAREFVVPATSLPWVARESVLNTHHVLLDEYVECLVDAVARDATTTLRYSATREAGEGLSVTLHSDPSSRTEGADSLMVVELTQAEYETLSAELESIAARPYHRRAETRPYLIHVGVVPQRSRRRSAGGAGRKARTMTE